ncbi:MAG: MtrB/PioB family decaheme-associated outer membrane protein [Magnetococcales bacterium]|nr:MtrB/PioB family decaheme-associated outer membrane protein [Magnetococcales bacterium]
MNRIKHTLTMASCFAALLGAVGGAEAQEMSETAAEFIKPESWFSIGVGLQDGNREQLGTFDNERGSGVRLLLDADLKVRDDKTGIWKTAQIKNLGQDNRSVKLGYNHQGQWGVTLDYVSMPRVAPFTVYSSNSGLGTATHIINTTAAAGSGPEVEVKTNRDRTKLSLYKNVKDHLRFNFNFSNQIKSGTRVWGQRGYGDGGSYPEFLLEPNNHTIRDMDTSVNYMSDKLQLTLGYFGSWFSNEDNLVNVTRETGTATSPYISLPLDNEAHKLHMSGGYNFTDTTRGAFKVSYNRALQNERMHLSDITGLSISDTAPTSLEGRIDTTLVQVDVTSRPNPKLNVLAKLRYLNDEDRTPPWEVVTGSTTIRSNPISKTTYTGKVEATYRLPDRTRVTAGIKHEFQDREVPIGNDSDGDGFDNERVVPFRTELSETTYKLQLRRALTQIANGSLSYKHSERDGSNYTDGDRLTESSTLQITPYYISDRTRDKLRLAVDVRPIDVFGLQFSSEYVNDKHSKGDRPHGRDKARTQLYSIDADYAYSSDLLFTAWYSRQIDEIWLGTYYAFNGTNPAEKYSEVEDTSDSIGFGVRNQYSDSIKLGANLLMTVTEVKYNDVVEPTGVTQLPEIESETTKFNAFVEYVGLGPGTLRADYVYERWDTNDWTWQFSDGSPYSYLTDGTTIVADDVQESNFIGVRYTTEF